MVSKGFNYQTDKVSLISIFFLYHLPSFIPLLLLIQGVLRGARTRFQLFGDTVNTASRIESNGLRDKIQVSQYTAQLLTAAGKGSWLKKRDDLIEAKGKGM